MRGSLWLATALTALAIQAQVPPIRDPHVFHAATDLISVTVTVRDPDGRLVADLPRDAFDLREDGAPQPISVFAHERVPLSIGVLLDTSDSMFGRRLDDARAAVGRFTDLLDPGDEFALVAFNHQMHVVMNWSDDRREVKAALQRLRPSGSTALYDALLASLPLVDIRHRERVAFLVISDGADTASDAKLRDVRVALNHSEAFVYAVAIDSPDKHAINASVDSLSLQAITNQSGGRTEIVSGSGALQDALSRIAEELNSQYVLGYAPPKGTDGEYHTIRVRIRGNTAYRIQARNGYVAMPPR